MIGMKLLGHLELKIRMPLMIILQCDDRQHLDHKLHRR